MTITTKHEDWGAVTDCDQCGTELAPEDIVDEGVCPVCGWSNGGGEPEDRADMEDFDDE